MPSSPQALPSAFSPSQSGAGSGRHAPSLARGGRTLAALAHEWHKRTLA